MKSYITFIINHCWKHVKRTDEFFNTIICYRMLLTNSSQRHRYGYGIGRWKNRNVVKFDTKETVETVFKLLRFSIVNLFPVFMPLLTLARYFHVDCHPFTTMRCRLDLWRGYLHYSRPNETPKLSERCWCETQTASSRHRRVSWWGTIL